MSYQSVVLATSGLASVWPLDEEAGTKATDSVGTNHGTYNGSPGLGKASLLANGEGKSVDLTPATQMVGAADSASLDLGDVFTLEAWIRPDVVNANQGIISKGNGGYYLRLNSGGKLELLKSQQAAIVASTVGLSKETAYHVVATKSAATVKLYIDSVDRTGSVSNATCSNNAIELNIGGDSGFSSERFDGRIQFAAVYSIALSEATVKAHFDAAAPAVRPLPGSRSLLGVGR